MIKIFSLTVLAAVVVVVVFAIGCGSGGDSTSASLDIPSVSSSPLSKAAYIKKADVQCDKGNQEQSEALRAYAASHRATTSGRAGELVLLKKVVLPHIQVTIEKFGEIEGPKGDRSKINAIVKANLRAIQESKKDLTGLLNSTGTPASDTSPFKEGTRLSMAYGFKVCGQY